MAGAWPTISGPTSPAMHCSWPSDAGSRRAGCSTTRTVGCMQYASGPYRAILARHGLRCSMSRRGNCLDNAPMESFFGSLKNELVHRTSFPTRETARRAIFEYIEAFYNRRRRH